MARSGFNSKLSFGIPGVPINAESTEEKRPLSPLGVRKFYIPTRRIQADQDVHVNRPAVSVGSSMEAGGGVDSSPLSPLPPMSTLQRDVEKRIEQLGQVQMGFLCEQLAAFRQDQAAQISGVRRLLQKSVSSDNQEVEGGRTLPQGLLAQQPDEDLKDAVGPRNKATEKFKKDLERSRALMQAEMRRFDAREASLKSNSAQPSDRPSERSCDTDLATQAATYTKSCDTDLVAQAAAYAKESAFDAFKSYLDEFQQLAQSLQCQISNCSVEIDKLTAHGKSTDVSIQDIRSSVENVRQEQVLHTQEEQTLRMIIEKVSCVVNDLKKREQEEPSRSSHVLSHARDTAKLQKLLSEDNEQLKRLEADFATIRSEQRAHSHTIEEISESLVQVNACLPHSAAWKNFAGLMDAERSTRSQECNSISGRIDECMEHARATRHLLETEFETLADNLETRSREEREATLAKSVRYAGEAMREDFQELAQAERMARTNELRKLTDQIDACVTLVQNVQAPELTLTPRFESALVAEEKSRIQLYCEVQTWIGQEAQKRDEVDSALWKTLQESMQRLETVEEKGKASCADVDALRQGLQKVVEVARSEHEKLREDCCDAIQNAWKINGIPDPFLGSTGSAPAAIHRV
jgi:hypothetical protein